MCNFGEITVVNKRNYKGSEAVDISRHGSVGLGNPFVLKRGETKGSTLPSYRRYLWQLYQAGGSQQWATLQQFASEVKAGNNLVLSCYCAPGPCHGDVIKSAILWLVNQQ